MLRLAAVVAVVVVAYLVWPLARYGLQLSNGYGAKIGCSVVFVSGRSIESANEAEFMFPPVRFFTTFEVDHVKKCILAKSRISMDTRVACWKNRRLGCTLEHEGSNLVIVEPKEVSLNSSLPFPVGNFSKPELVEQARKDVDMERLAKAVYGHFNDTKLHARAFVVIKDDQIIFEHYGDNCTRDTPLLGWSMTKSWINALLGIRVQQERIKDGLDTKVALEEWKGDPERQALTIRKLLRMSDGLDYDEVYNLFTDPPEMLFMRASLVMQERLLRIPLQAREHDCFHYSSHSTNVLCRYLLDTFDSTEEYLKFPTEALFNPLHMQTAVLETDPNNIFIGSSFGYATALDWARFGMLYLYDGVFEGERILPEGWVDFSKETTPTSYGVYGAHFWKNDRNHGDDVEMNEKCDSIFTSRVDPTRTWMPHAWPPGAFVAHGFEEQSVTIIPQSNAVVVRMGQTKEDVIQWDRPGFYSEVFKSLPNSGM